MAMVFAAFLTIGVAMPVLPLHVHERLGLGAFVVGLVAGSEFAAALVTRIWAGRHADSRGATQAMIIGLSASAAAGLLYWSSLTVEAQPALSATILILGRSVLGAGESFVIIGAKSLGFDRAGKANTGKVIAWMGTAMYTAFVLGAPIGTALYRAYGFNAIALVTIALPLATLLLAVRMKPVAPTARGPVRIGEVIGSVWVPGLGLALACFGFGATIAFSPLLFAARGWPVWPAFTSFASARALCSATFLTGSVAPK